MLIETNDKKNVGTIIFSENKFDFVTNFTKINKREPDHHVKIDFKEVSDFISQPIEKSLILYRLITNDENLDPFSSKLGYFIKVIDSIEVVYFDPIFIIKDIENLKFTIPKKEFRFKIQQVGFRTKSIKGETAIYEERFSINMSDIEAQNQNDSLFAETMLSIKGGLNIKKGVRNVDKDNNSFEKVSTEFSKKEKQFYRLDGNDKRKNSTYVKQANREEEGSFFARVKLRKEKDEYKSNTLKMFK